MLKNLVEETANSPGTGATVTLGGAPTGRRTWRGSGYANGAQVYYFITDGTIAEWGIGTLTLSATDTLSRDTVIGNTSGTTSRLNFTGTCRVYNSLPAERSLYVGQSAITLDGDLTVSKASPQFTLDKAASGQDAVISGSRAGSLRWRVVLGSTAAETGVGNAGSDFGIYRYSNAGAYINTSIAISRSSGQITFDTVTATFTGAITATSGTFSGAVAAASLTVGGSSMWEPGDVKTSARSTPSAGWLLCNGAAVSRSTYAALYSAIGDAFGAGDGATTFNLPDFRDKFLRGTSSTVGTTGGAATGTTSTGGSHNHGGAVGGTAITIGQMPSHGHTGYTNLTGAHFHLSGTTGLYSAYSGGVSNPGEAIFTGGGGTTTISFAATSTEPNHQHTVDVYAVGGGETHTHSISTDSGHTHTVATVPPFVGVNYFIKT